MTLRKSKIEETMPPLDDANLQVNLKISSFCENLKNVGNYLSHWQKIPGNHHFLTNMNTFICGIPIFLVGNRKKILGLRRCENSLRMCIT